MPSWYQVVNELAPSQHASYNQVLTNLSFIIPILKAKNCSKNCTESIISEIPAFCNANFEDLSFGKLVPKSILDMLITMQ